MRYYYIIGWLLLIALALYFYFFRAGFVQGQLEQAFSLSVYLGYGFFLLLGCLRGFTLIPVTALIVLGLLFIPPVPLFILIISGVVISSISIYYFSELMQLDKLLEKKYQKPLTKIRSALTKHELPIIIGWSAFPFLPTDLICYVCGTLRVNVKKMILGILIGESLTSGLYIFLGHHLLQYVHLGF